MTHGFSVLADSLSNSTDLVVGCVPIGWRRYPCRECHDIRHGVRYHSGGKEVSILSNSVVLALTVLRASKFFRLYGVALLSDMALSPASGALSNIQPWWPARFGLIAYVMAILTTVLVLPETFIKPAALSSTNLAPTAPVEEGEPEEEEDDPVLYADAPKHTLWRRVRKIVSSLRDLRYLIASRQVLLLVPLLSVGQLYDQSAGFFLNYVSRRYGWRISQASFWLTYRNVVNLVLLSTILPEVSALLLKRGYSAGKKDLWISRASIVCLALGAFFIGLAPTLTTMVIGEYLLFLSYWIQTHMQYRPHNLRPRPRLRPRRSESSDSLHRTRPRWPALHSHDNRRDNRQNR